MRRAERATLGTRMPLVLDIDKTTRDEHLDEVVLDHFVAVRFSMVSRIPHNKEKKETNPLIKAITIESILFSSVTSCIAVTSSGYLS